MTLLSNRITALVEPDNMMSGFGGVFALVAAELTANGVVVVPVGGRDGKTPLVERWGKRSRPYALKTIEEWSSRFGSCGVGIATGAGSSITVVDIDDARLVDQMLARFGDTPLKARTPSGGWHLYYRHAGEASGNLRGEGLDVDIKGTGGFVVAPPTVRSTGPHAGKAYAFISGGWHDLDRLPRLNPEGLRAGTRTGASVLSARAVERGRRNDTLFRHALRLVKTCATFEALFGALLDIRDRTFADDPDDPFTDSEVRKTARRAWKMEAEGDNWVGTKGTFQMARADFDVLVGNTDALALGMHLRFQHGSRMGPDAFALSAKAMANAETLPGWKDPRRYVKARDFLVDVGFLELTHRGGRGKRDPNLYRLTAFGKGAVSAPNVTEHPPILSNDEPTSRPARTTAASWQTTFLAGNEDVICIADLFGHHGLVTAADVDAWSGGLMPPELVAGVRRIARARGLTHEGLARMVGCSRPQLSNILVRKFGAGPDVAAHLRDFLKAETTTEAV